MSTHTCQISSGSVYCVALEKPKKFFRHFQLQHSMTARPPPSGAETKLNAMHIYTVCQKNVQPLACYNFDAHEWILIFFGRNVTDKVGNQKTLYYATSNNLCFCTTWQNAEKRKSHFTQLDCVTHTMHLCALFLKEKNVTCDVFDSV